MGGGNVADPGGGPAGGVSGGCDGAGPLGSGGALGGCTDPEKTEAGTGEGTFVRESVASSECPVP